MVIAANFRKYPEAMALQFPLRLGKPVWITARPTTRLGRAFRAAVGTAAKAAAALPWAARLELAKIGKKPAPQWVKDAQRRARALGVWVREALMMLNFNKADHEAWAIAQNCKTTHATSQQPDQGETMSIVELYAPAERHFSRLEQEDRQHYEKWLLANGARVVAEEVAVERGLSGMAAEYFVDGFNGRSAAYVNPRKDGMEPVFREGRRAKNEKGMAQRIRAAAAALRAKEGYAMNDWLEIAYPCRPVPWRSAFGG